jgi:hypothetical protein
MTKQNIQKAIEDKKKQVEKLNRDITELEKDLVKETDKNEWLDVSDVLPNCEVELTVHDKNKSWDDLGLKDKENQLLTVEQCIALANSKYASQLKMDGSSSNDDFFIKQPFNLNRSKGYVAVFYCGGDGSCFGSDWDSDDAVSCRGVRLIREKIKGNKK